MHVGFDDTDSTRRGCTTYVAALLVEKLQKLNADFVDYPNLVRLNPNVPWKTRGNGALCLRIRFEENDEERFIETVLDTVEKNSDLEAEKTNPGVVFVKNTRIPQEIRNFARKVVTGIVDLSDALKLVTKFNAEAVGFKNCRGIIGSLAAIGEDLQADHTYEVLAYRIPENYGLKREVDVTSIFKMDEATKPYIFNNIDVERGRVIITPRGPDPILFGVRGETAEIVKRAFEMVRAGESIERWVIFRTNQGTDAHLNRADKLTLIKPFSSVIANGKLTSNPITIPTRHVIFSIKDESAEVDCAAYEPTGALRKTARKLVVGDSVEIYGGVKEPSKGRPLTINLEKIRVTKLAPKFVYRNPTCPKCDKRLKSMGRDKGFRCEKCGLRDVTSRKVEVAVKRDVKEGLYITSTRSQRHLTKPYSRYGMEKHHVQVEKLIEDWHFP